MGWAVFWMVACGVLAAGLVRWYFWARPHPRFDKTGHPRDMKRSVGRFKTVTGWDHTHTVKTCPACGGAGALQYEHGQKKVIPREQWEATIWRRANVVDCPACHGLGYVGRNWKPPPRFRWPQGAPVGT